jgi:hypothetical protein
MKRAQFQFALPELNLDISKIKKLLVDQDDGSQEIISCLIDDGLKEVEGICNIKGEYIVYTDIKFNNQDKSLEIADVKFNLNRLIYKEISISDSIAVFLCTAGKEIGVVSRKMMNDGDLLKGYIYDFIGTAIVDAAADYLHGKLAAVMKEEGQKITNRYMPGHCKWNVSEQEMLFSLIPDNYCGIRLTDSFLMDPVKSISGIIGIGENVRYNPNTCDLCDFKNCAFRKTEGKEKVKI